MKNRNHFIYAGLLLIAIALLMVCYNIRLDQRAKIISDQALEELLAQIKENTNQSQASNGISANAKTDNGESAAETDPDPENAAAAEEVPQNAGTLDAEETATEADPEAEAPEEQAEAAPQPKPAATLSAGSYAGVISIPAISRTLPVASTVSEIETLQPTAIQEMVFKECDLTIFTCTIGGQRRLTVRCQKTGQ